jgi:histidyl-tRNA synthetase
MNKIVKPEKPAGFLDYDTKKFFIREKIVNSINEIFVLYGYNPIETPIVEFTKTLIGNDETSKNIFFLRGSKLSSKEEISLRFDHTVPFARFLAANPYNKSKREGVRLPWRRSVYGPVFRNDTPQKGRFRQFYQFDIDIAGTDSMLADAEIVAIIYKVLQSLSVGDFVIKINNRKILNGFKELLRIGERSKVSSTEITTEIMRILDKIQKYSWEELKEELKRSPVNEFDPSPNLNNEQIFKIEDYLNIKGENNQKLQKCYDLFKDIKISEKGIEELEALLSYLSYFEIDLRKIEIDLSIARGLDYYTGPVFESFISSSPDLGSVFSGGRYDNLMTRFTGEKLPAVGASIGVDRLITILEYLKLTKNERDCSADIIILRLSNNPHFIDKYLSIAETLRKNGIKTELSLFDDLSFSAQFNFAISQNYNYVLIMGEQEETEKECIIKNLKTRNQKKVKLKELKNFTLKNY